MMLNTLVEQSTRIDGKLKPNAALVAFLANEYPELSKYPVPEQTYLAINGIADRTCPAGNVKFFLSYNRGYRPTCGKKGCPCMKTEKRKAGRSELNKRSAATWREKTGLKSPSQLPGVGEKISATGKKIGKERFKKIQATMKGRHGVSSYLEVPGVQAAGIIAAQSDKSRERRVTTNIKRYGFENPAKNKEVARRSLIGQIQGDVTRRAVFWESVNSTEWWAGQTRTSVDEFMKEFILSDSTKTRYIGKFRPDLLDVRVSSPHQRIMDYLDSIGVDYVHNDRTIMGPMELDIVIPKYGVAIEINGLYWHSEARGKNRSYHIRKTMDCEAAGYRLLHFWDFEIDTKWDICASIIGQAVGFSKRIHARQCVVRDVPVHETREFLSANHIQGFIGSTIAKGLYYGDRIVAIMTFGRSRFNDEFEWEILRSCNALGTTVVGGASKLFARRPEGSIISYADRRLFDGGVYAALGFEFAGASDPSYWYTRDYLSLESRFKYQKHRLSKLLPSYDPAFSESVNMANAGYDRVWDCGNTRWVMKC